MYLAANGGGHHGIHVTGIKKNKLVRIMFRTMNQKLTTFSDLKTTAEKSVESCSDLIGKYQIKQADCTEVKKAFTAVGLLGP
jgi:Zn-dependent metalloprotease